MKYPNLQAIKHQLPRGAMTQIANDLGITTKKVSDFFNHGWHKGLTNDILSKSVELIEGSGMDDGLMEKLGDLKLTSNYRAMPVARQKKKNNPGYSLGEDYDDDVEFLGELSFDDLCGVVFSEGLDLDTDDYEPGFLTTEEGRTEALQEAILDCYYSEDEEDED